MPRFTVLFTSDDYMMKDSSTGIVEKPSSCDNNGNLMKLTNEDHLMVHRKRNDMVLNIGPVSKVTTFSDQTPTPIRFIRNCEEIGLFQDLQNVNPFEETFRKAVEAAKAGQTSLLEKSSSTNTSDDTLHTPNIFPHMTDLTCVNTGNDIGTHKNSSNEENLQRHIIQNDNIAEKELEEAKQLVLDSVSPKKEKTEYKNKSVAQGAKNYNLLNNVENATFYKHTQSITGAGESNQTQVALKEKIKSSIQNRQVPILLKLKVPIPKSNSAVIGQKSQKDRFSTFSKNSLKLESKLENSQANISDWNKKRISNKNYYGLTKERIEELERNRAAATRCREKKKIYVSYLEKLNRELTDTNKKLQLHNINLRKQVEFLQAELLKHGNYSTTNQIPKSIPTNMEICGDTEKKLRTENSNSKGVLNQDIKNTMEFSNSKDETSKTSVISGPLTTVFTTEEVVSDSWHENESIKHVLDSSNSGSIEALSSSSNTVKTTHEDDKIRKIYTDHSYSTSTNVTGKKCNANSSKHKFGNIFLKKYCKNDAINENKKNSLKIILPHGDSLFKTFNSQIACIIPQPSILLNPINNYQIVYKEPNNQLS